MWKQEFSVHYPSMCATCKRAVRDADPHCVAVLMPIALPAVLCCDCWNTAVIEITHNPTTELTALDLGGLNPPWAN
jgi:predicted amidophosphoribosyltransferase